METNVIRLLAVIFALTAMMMGPAAQATEFSVIYSFSGTPDGSGPQAALAFDAASKAFYGTTSGGGTASQGTVYRITPAGRESVLYSFAGGSDGQGPFGGVVLDAKGNIYGTTTLGGANGSGCDFGCGTVYKIAPDGTHSVVYAFQGGTDGIWPEASLITDKKGNLYGTTFEGGNGYGTIFRIAPDGKETILHAFTNADGSMPVAAVLSGRHGALYGTTGMGGADGQGTVFQLARDGSENVVHSFTLGSDGGNPASTLISGSQGNLYGTTANGGKDINGGTVFMLTPGGSETVLHNFTGGNDGAKPACGVVTDSAGNLYGTTLQGGSAGNFGTVYRVAPDGKETILHAFGDGNDGGWPYAALAADDKGQLFGTTEIGGTYNRGVVFRIKP